MKELQWRPALCAGSCIQGSASAEFGMKHVLFFMSVREGVPKDCAMQTAVSEDEG